MLELSIRKTTDLVALKLLDVPDDDAIQEIVEETSPGATETQGEEIAGSVLDAKDNCIPTAGAGPPSTALDSSTGVGKSSMLMEIKETPTRQDGVCGHDGE